MSAFLPYDSSLGAVPVTQGIGDADPSHSGFLHHSWDFGGDAPAFATHAGFLPGKTVSDNSTIQA